MLRLPALATALVLLMLAGYWGEGRLAAERKLSSLGMLDARGSYRITLEFAPERFHQQRLQDAGRLVEVRERSVLMMDVTPAALHQLAALYWVDSIARWAPP